MLTKWAPTNACVSPALLWTPPDHDALTWMSAMTEIMADVNISVMIYLVLTSAPAELVLFWTLSLNAKVVALLDKIQSLLNW